METKIAVVAAPTGYDKTDYQFFKNETTGNCWKASVERLEARTAMIGQADIETAASEYAVRVTVSPIDDNGKALRDELDRPIILDSHTHTFTGVEMAAPDFDPITRLMSIVAERVHAGEARLKGGEEIVDAVDLWNKKAMLKAKPYRYSGVTNEGTALPGVVLIVGKSDETGTVMPEADAVAASDAPPASETPPAS